MMNALKPYENCFKKVYGTDEKVLEFQNKRYFDDPVRMYLKEMGPLIAPTPGHNRIKIHSVQGLLRIRQ